MVFQVNIDIPIQSTSLAIHYMTKYQTIFTIRQTGQSEPSSEKPETGLKRLLACFEI